MAALLLAVFVAPAAAQQDCPAELARDLASEAPECQVVGQGRLASALGNGDVDWRLYRWVSTREEAPSEVYDAPPYNQTAVTLSLAARPDAPPFWSGWYLQGVAWFETPYLAKHKKWGEFLVVPGRYAGTGSFTENHVFMPNHAGGWTEIRAGQAEDGGTEKWVRQLLAALPEGHGIWKGIRVDYATLSGTTPVWRDGDANCCPSGGELWFRLTITGPEIGFEVAETRHTPPQ